MEPMQDKVAAQLPEMEPNTAHAITAIAPRLPLILPTNIETKSTRDSPIPL